MNSLVGVYMSPLMCLNYESGGLHSERFGIYYWKKLNVFSQYDACFEIVLILVGMGFNTVFSLFST